MLSLTRIILQMNCDLVHSDKVVVLVGIGSCNPCARSAPAAPAVQSHFHGNRVLLFPYRSKLRGHQGNVHAKSANNDTQRNGFGPKNTTA
jgi:hypothetical protein